MFQAYLLFYLNFGISNIHDILSKNVELLNRYIVWSKKKATENTGSGRKGVGEWHALCVCISFMSIKKGSGK